jgi:hypothetical protein
VGFDDLTTIGIGILYRKFALKTLAGERYCAALMVIESNRGNRATSVVRIN